MNRSLGPSVKCAYANVLVQTCKKSRVHLQYLQYAFFVRVWSSAMDGWLGARRQVDNQPKQHPGCAFACLDDATYVVGIGSRMYFVSSQCESSYHTTWSIVGLVIFLLLRTRTGQSAQTYAAGTYKVRVALRDSLHMAVRAQRHELPATLPPSELCCLLIWSAHRMA